MMPEVNQYFDRLLLTRRIFLFDELKPGSSREIIEDLLLLDDMTEGTGNREPISLFINSSGGNVWEAMAIISTIESLKSEVHTYAMGHVGSCATLIFLAGKRRFILPKATLMLHEIEWAHPLPSRVGHALSTIAGVDETYQIIVDFITERTGLRPRKVRRLLRQETWWNAKKAVADHLADQLITSFSIELPKGKSPASPRVGKRQSLKV